MFTSKSTLASLQKRAAAITDVFTKTKNDSLALAQDVKALSSQKQDEIAKLQVEVTSLDFLAKGHENLAAKIDSFLNS
jgi:hypothetical protein